MRSVRTWAIFALLVTLVGGLLDAPSRAGDVPCAGATNCITIYCPDGNCDDTPVIVDDTEPIAGKFRLRTSPRNVLKTQESISVRDYWIIAPEPTELQSAATHYDILIWQRIVAFSTCDDLISCSKECDTTCEDVYGNKAKKAEIKKNTDGSSSCQCECNDVGVISIECVTPEFKLKPNSIIDQPDPVGAPKITLPVKRQ